MVVESCFEDVDQNLKWLKTVFCFLRLIELGAVFQAWNCTVFNGCAIC